MIEIQLAHGYTAIVDDEDADLAAFKWLRLLSGNNVYAYRRVKSGKRYVTQLMHRVILGRMVGRPLLTSEQTDHIHGVTLDNRRSELRMASKTQNGQNKKYSGSKSSNLKGASYYKRRNKWIAQIVANGQRKHLGYFDTMLDAHKEYCLASLYYFKEFANFGDGSPFTKAELSGVKWIPDTRKREPKLTARSQRSPNATRPNPRTQPEYYSNLIIETQKKMRGWNQPTPVEQEHEDAA